MFTYLPCDLGSGTNRERGSLGQQNIPGVECLLRCPPPGGWFTNICEGCRLRSCFFTLKDAVSLPPFLFLEFWRSSSSLLLSSFLIRCLKVRVFTVFISLFRISFFFLSCFLSDVWFSFLFLWVKCRATCDDWQWQAGNWQTGCWCSAAVSGDAIQSRKQGHDFTPCIFYRAVYYMTSNLCLLLLLYVFFSYLTEGVRVEKLCQDCTVEETRTRFHSLPFCACLPTTVGSFLDMYAC